MKTTFYAVKDIENEHIICYQIRDLKTARQELSKWKEILSDCQHSELRILKITEELVD